MDWMIHVKGMTCSTCKESVEGALKALPGVNSVMVDLDTGDVTVSIVEGKVDEARMKSAVEAIGFDVY